MSFSVYIPCYCINSMLIGKNFIHQLIRKWGTHKQETGIQRALHANEWDTLFVDLGVNTIDRGNWLTWQTIKHASEQACDKHQPLEPKIVIASPTLTEKVPTLWIQDTNITEPNSSRIITPNLRLLLFTSSAATTFNLSLPYFGGTQWLTGMDETGSGTPCTHLLKWWIYTLNMTKWFK